MLSGHVFALDGHVILFDNQISHFDHVVPPYVQYYSYCRVVFRVRPKYDTRP